MKLHFSSPASPPQIAHQHFPLAGIFFCRMKLQLCHHSPAHVLSLREMANPGVAGSDPSCHLPQLCLLHLATETTDSNSLGPSESLKKLPYLHIISPFYLLFLCDTSL